MNIYAVYFIEEGQWKRQVKCGGCVNEAHASMKQLLENRKARYTIMWVEKVSVKLINTKNTLPKGKI